MDQKTTLQELKEKVQKFCEERNWDQFHSPKELAIGMSIEASELLEHFRFKSEKEIGELFQQKEKKEKIDEEIIDILFYLLRFSQKYNISLTEAFSKKMKKNEEKYPVEKAKNSNKKYSEF